MSPDAHPSVKRALLFAGLLTLLQSLPWLRMLGHGISIIAFATEPIGYRYFHSFRLLHGDKSAIWEAQGQTLGVLHHLLNHLLDGASVADLQARLEWFGYGTLTIISLLWGTVCYLLGRHPLLTWMDRALLGGAGLFGFYGSFWGRTSSVLPDYYSLETIATVACAGLFLVHLRQPLEKLTPRRASLIGILGGLMVGIKITLLPAAFLPLLPYAMPRPLKPARLAIVLLAWAGGVIVTMGAILILYYRGNFEQLLLAFQAWRQFVAAPGAEPGFIGRLLNPLAAIGKPWNDHQFVLVALGLWLAALVPLVITALTVPASRWRLGVVTAFALCTAALHIYAIAKRPAETTLFESTLFLVSCGATLLVVAPGPPLSRHLVPFWATALAGWCLFSALRYLPDATTYARLHETSRNSWEIHRWLTGTGRPLIIFFPDNRYAANTVEEALMKGFSDTPTWNITAGQTLLDQVAPRRHFVQSLDAIPPGHIVMWTEIAGAPALTDSNSVLAAMEREARTWALPRDYAEHRLVHAAPSLLPPIFVEGK